MLAVFVFRAYLAEHRSIFRQLFDIAAFFDMRDIDRTIRYFDVGDVIFLKKPEIIIELVADEEGLEQEPAEINGDAGVHEEFYFLMQTGGDEGSTKGQLYEVHMRACP